MNHCCSLALMDADVKLQTLLDLTASVRQAECTEFLLKNAHWPQLAFNPVQVRELKTIFKLGETLPEAL